LLAAFSGGSTHFTAYSLFSFINPGIRHGAIRGKDAGNGRNGGRDIAAAVMIKPHFPFFIAVLKHQYQYLTDVFTVVSWQHTRKKS